MMAIMLDPHFKSLSIVKDLLGHGNAIRLAIEYDAKIVFLMVYFEWLNLIVVNASTAIAVPTIVGEEFGENMFGVKASIVESSCALFSRELSLFKRLSILPFACVDPFTWWRIHEG
jgi:hypothetical protein